MLKCPIKSEATAELGHDSLWIDHYHPSPDPEIIIGDVEGNRRG